MSNLHLMFSHKGPLRVRDPVGGQYPAKGPGPLHDAGSRDHGLQGRHAKNHGHHLQTQSRRSKGEIMKSHLSKVGSFS